MSTPTETDVHNALRLILQNREAKALNWAVNYAHAGLAMHGEELRVQCLYVLGNISHWRNENTKHVRATLKEFANSH